MNLVDLMALTEADMMRPLGTGHECKPWSHPVRGMTHDSMFALTPTHMWDDVERAYFNGRSSSAFYRLEF
jgi:hypothetical protein